MFRPRSAFTMLELLLAIGLAVIILSLAIPTLGSVMSSNGLEDQFHKFESFVQSAQAKAVNERRTINIVWYKEGLAIEPEILRAEDADQNIQKFAFGEAKLSLQRPFAMEKDPPAVWPFWRSGSCEPVRVIFEGKEGSWAAEFDPLTAKGTLVDMKDK